MYILIRGERKSTVLVVYIDVLGLKVLDNETFRIVRIVPYRDNRILLQLPTTRQPRVCININAKANHIKIYVTDVHFTSLGL